MTLIVGAILFVVGAVTLLRGKLVLPGRRCLGGGAARAAGLLLMGPLTAGLAAGGAVSLAASAKGLPADDAALASSLTAVRFAWLAVCCMAAAAIGAMQVMRQPVPAPGASAQEAHPAKASSSSSRWVRWAAGALVGMLLLVFSGGACLVLAVQWQERLAALPVVASAPADPKPTAPVTPPWQLPPEDPAEEPAGPDIPRQALKARIPVGDKGSAALSPDGLTLATNDTRGMRLWETATGKERAKVTDGSLSHLVLQFAPDGQWLVLNGVGHTVGFRSAKTGRHEGTFEVGTEAHQVAFTPDGRALVIRNAQELRVLDLTTGHVRRLLERGQLDRGVVPQYMQPTPDGRLFLALARTTGFGTGVPEYQFWDLQTGRPGPAMAAKHAFPQRQLLTPDGKHLAMMHWTVGEAAKRLTVYDLEAGREVAALEAAAPITCLAFAPDGKTAATGHADGSVAFWDWPTRRKRTDFQARERTEPLFPTQAVMLYHGGVHGLWFTPDGRTLVTHTGKGLKVWDLGRLLDKPLEVLPRPAVTPVPLPPSLVVRAVPVAPEPGGPEVLPDKKPILGTGPGEVTGLAVSADGKLVAAGHGKQDGLNRRVVKHFAVVRDAATGNVLRSFEVRGQVRSLAFTPDGKRLLVGGGNWLIGFKVSVLHLFDIESGNEVRSFKGHTQPVTGVTLTSDGRQAVSVGGDGLLCVWDLDKDTPLHSYTVARDARLTGLVLSPEGQRAIVAGAQEALIVWDLENGKELHRFEQRTIVAALASPPTGQRLVTCDGQRSIRVWDIEKQLKVLEVTGDAEDQVLAVAYSPDGRYILSGGFDQVMRMWDARTMRLLAVREEHRDPITAFAFGPDGKWFVSGSDDRTVRRWTIGGNK